MKHGMDFLLSIFSYLFFFLVESVAHGPEMLVSAQYLEMPRPSMQFRYSSVKPC